MTNLMAAVVTNIITLTTPMSNYWGNISMCSNAVYSPSRAHIEQAESMRANTPQYVGATVDLLIQAMKDMQKEIEELNRRQSFPDNMLEALKR
jgi:hypothetical protein